ncbi:MAG: hypothetical protein ACOX45_05910 [Acutalibacteraceae bacterium]
MEVLHGDYLSFNIPNYWMVEDNTNTTSVYNMRGDGAITMSFYTAMSVQKSFDEHVCIMAKKFIDNNRIRLRQSLILDNTKKDKLVLYGTGITIDNWFIKFWVIAKFPRIVLATYQSEKATSEIKTVDNIIESISFLI